MSTQETNLKAIADAIREKDGTTAPIPAKDFPERILAIETGGKLPEDVRTISLTADPPEGGTVFGGGVASDGMMVTVETDALQGYRFKNWVENGAIISTDKQLTFNVAENRMLKAVFEAQKNHNLPEGFTEVEYIYVDVANTPGLIIQTNYVLTEEDVLTVQYARREDDNYSSFMGYPYGSSANQRTAYNVKNATSSTFPNAFAAMSSWNNYTYFQTLVYDNKFEFTIDFPNKAMTLHIGEQVESHSFAQMPNNYSVLRFLSDYASTASYSTVSTGYLYGCKITDARGVVKTEFVPCINNSSGIVGLYDTAAKRMYTSSASTNSHILAGPAV